MILKVLFILVFISPEDSLQTNTRTTLQESNRDSIETAMILRSEDLIWQTDWNVFSIDRMSFKVNTGHYGYYGPQPGYLLNDIPFDPGFFGMNYSQLLPVSFSRIQNLKTTNGAGVYNGVNYNSGIINIQSIPLKQGFSISANGQFGHNADEPGPWIFDENQVTPNVERFGPWADAGAALKFGNWYAKGLIRTHSYLNINKFVQLRTKNLVGFPERGDWPEANATTYLGLAETGLQSKRVNLRVQAIRSESEEFLYFQPIAREIPTDFSTEQYSVLGSVSPYNWLGIRTMVQYRKKSTGYHRNPLGEEFDWRQNQKIGRASAYLNFDNYRLDAGSEIRRIETDASGLNDDNQQYIDFFLDQEIDITSWFRLGTYSALTLHDDEYPVSGRAFLEFDIFDEWTTTFEGLYTELLPEISNPIADWISSGYNILERMNVLTFVPNEIPNSRLFVLAQRNRFQLSDRVAANLKFQYLNHLSFHVPYQNARYNIYVSTSPGGYFFYFDQSGRRVNASIDADLRWTNSFHQTVGVSWSKTIEGDKSYRRYWETVSEYLVRHSSVFTPYPDIELRLNVQYQTKTVWDEFKHLDGKLNRTFHVQFPPQFFRYRNTIPGNVNIDLVLSKWFWEQRIRAVFMLSNLFNQKYQTHPIGSQEGFGYMLRLELQI